MPIDFHSEYPIKAFHGQYGIGHINGLLAVLCGLVALSATLNAIAPETAAPAAVGYRPPVTSTIAPVV